MKTKVLVCNCNHEYQDGRYGKGKRLHNFVTKDWKEGQSKKWRCTVCENVKGE